MDIQELRKFVESKKSEKLLLEKQVKEKQISIVRKEKYQENLIKTRWLLTEASRLTQMNIQNQIESLVTMAIRSVYERDFKFLVEFEIKRNKTECLLRVQEGEKEPYIPKEDQGGGLLDVISLALRIVLWSMEKPRSRNIFILDEPGKWTGVLIVKFGEMLKEISKELGLQILMVTHDSELVEIADRAWKVIHDGRFSEVKLLQ
uniref:Putative ATPase domain containing protein n=1 Tax=viral metagenome TaxID=1070528 RepID=A0A6M3L5T6_9ZZZZ